MTGEPASTPLCWWRVWFARVTISFFRIRLAKNERDQAGAKQDETGDGDGQETVGGELVTHDGDSRSN
jgi:hypothetical protein